MANKPGSGVLRVFCLSWLLLSLLAGLWAISTPIGGAPDEPAHLIKAASVVRGQFLGTPGHQGEVVQVPKYVAHTPAQTCYAFRNDVTANCSPDVSGDPAQLVDAPTTAGLYNPVYYELVGWPSLFVHDSSGVYWMRIASGIVVSLFLACAVALISTWRRPTLPMLGLAIALTPMTLFLSGTVNPNSLEIAATLATFVGLLAVINEPDPDLLARRSIIVFVSAAIAANMRGLSLLWLAMAILAPFVLLGKKRIVELLRSRTVRLTVAGTALAAIGAGVWLLTTNSLGAGIDGSGAVTVPGFGASPWSGFSNTLSATFGYAQGMVGNFGWLDTPAPLSVYFTWSVLAGGLLLMGFILLRGRALVLAAILTAALILLPAIVQGAYITKGGIIWQGRYILPIFVCATVAVGAGLAYRVRLTRAIKVRMLAVVLSIWGAAQFASYATALHRYAVGDNRSWRELLSPAWSPPGGIWLSLVAFALVLVLAIIAVSLYLVRNPETTFGSVERPGGAPSPSHEVSAMNKQSYDRSDDESDEGAGREI